MNGPSSVAADLRAALERALTESQDRETSGDVARELATSEPASARCIVVDDPIIPYDPEGIGELYEGYDPYGLLRVYWPRLLGYFAQRADRFRIDAWSADAASIRAAETAYGDVVGAAGSTTVLSGPVRGDWVERVLAQCWGEHGEIRWMNVVLMEDGKFTLDASHHGGEIYIWLPSDVDVADLLALFPQRVGLDYQVWAPMSGGGERLVSTVRVQ